MKNKKAVDYVATLLGHRLRRLASLGVYGNFFLQKIVADYVALGLAVARPADFPMGRRRPLGADTRLAAPLGSA